MTISVSNATNGLLIAQLLKRTERIRPVRLLGCNWREKERGNVSLSCPASMTHEIAQQIIPYLAKEIPVTMKNLTI